METLVDYETIVAGKVSDEKKKIVGKEKMMRQLMI